MTMRNHHPKSVTYRSRTRELEIEYTDGTRARLDAEFLRVYSPSAEVRGHSESQRVLQTGKKHVTIDQLQPIGNYAVRIVFSDGHDTGIYSWNYLYSLYENRDRHWREYLNDLEKANASRLERIPVKIFTPESQE